MWRTRPRRHRRMPKASKLTFKLAFVGLGASVLAACGSSGVLSRERPDEFAVQRQAPLVIPPDFELVPPQPGAPRPAEGDRKSTRLNSSHVRISYAVFCLKKKKT